MLDGDQLDHMAAQDDVAAMKIRTGTLSDHDVMLVGYQRTKQINRTAREAWEAGDASLVNELVKTGRETILQGALLEIYREYLPLKQMLDAAGLKPKTVIDIGCGQALNDVFLHRDYKPAISLVDIEETEGQYHGWASSGSGYASLDSARAFLVDNGVKKSKVTTINPRRTPDALTKLSGDLVISLISCGFHYPIDEYADLMVATVEGGGAVCLDLRRKYLRRQSPVLQRLLDAGEVHTLYQQARSSRVLVMR